MAMCRAVFGDQRLPVRFWQHVDLRQVDGCWEWDGARAGTQSGYGVQKLAGKTRLVHRHAAHVFIRPVSDGEEVHHKCPRTRCVNPAHLEIMPAEKHWGHGQRDKTHCPHGHAYTPENTIVNKTSGHRNCRECNRCAAREYQRRKRVSV